MRTSRRDLIKKGALAGAATLLPMELLAAAARPGARSAVAPKLRPADTLPWLSRQMFLARLNDVFQIQTAQKGWVRTRLVRVEDTPSAKVAGTTGSPNCFTVVFETFAGFQQGTYALHNPATGVFNLFLVPGGGSLRSRYVVATINRV